MLLKRYAICRLSRETQTWTPWYQIFYQRPWPPCACDYTRLHGATFRVFGWRFRAVRQRNRLNDHIITLHDTTNYEEKVSIHVHEDNVCTKSTYYMYTASDFMLTKQWSYYRFFGGKLECNVSANTRQGWYSYWISFGY